jgi:hypothetical protein
MGRACGTCGPEETCVQSFGGETWTETACKTEVLIGG